MNARLFALLVCCSSTPAFADAARWTPVGSAERATITGGPWVLAQGTAASPTAGYPTPNPGTNAFAPYYHAYVFGDDSLYLGYFDYRPKDLGEAIVAAASTDQGRSWTFLSQALVFTPPSSNPNDDGFGHPFVLDVAGHTYLYTLDRTPATVDAAGLVVTELFADGFDPLLGAPAVADASAPDLVRTSGLSHPDGIIDVAPSADGAVRVLYLAKDVSVTPNVTTVHVAESWDGIVWSNDQLVSGLTSSARPFIGPRGTLVTYDDGSFGLFFSAGLVGEDADALHFIGYAESDDLVRWTVINDENHPIVSTEAAKDPTGGQPWYAGRVYAPTVVPGDDGCSATMMFSGYKTLKPKKAPNDYRQIGRITLDLCGAADPARARSAPVKTAHVTRSGAAASRAAAAAATATATPAPGSSSAGTASGGCAVARGADAGASVACAGLLLLLLAARARRPRC